MIDALLWVLSPGTNEIFIRFAVNNALLIILLLGGLKIVAKRTRNTVDDSIYELFRYWFDSARGLGKSAVVGIGKGTAKMVKGVAGLDH